MIREYDQHGTSAVNAVRFTRDGNYCLSASDDRTIRLWNPHKDDPRSTCNSFSSSVMQSASPLHIKTYGGGHGLGINDVTISKNNERFASCGGDKFCLIWDITSGSIVRRLQGHSQRINSVDMNDDGSLLMTASYDSTVSLWDLRSSNRDPVQTLRDFKDSVTCVVHTRQHVGKIIASSVDGSIRIFDIRSGLVHVDQMKEPIACIRLSHDESSVLATCIGGEVLATGSVRLVEISSGRLLQEYQGHVNNSYKTESCLSCDDVHVLSGSEEGNIWVWNLITGKVNTKLCIRNAHKKAVSSLSYHPNLPFFVSSSYDGSVKCWKGEQ